MIVNEQHPIRLENLCGALYDETKLIEAILWYADKPVASKKTVYMHGRYPAVSIYKEKIHIHRLLMMCHMNRCLDRNEHVHHRNENRKDAMSDNLELTSATEHIRGHLLGKKQLPEHVKKRIAAMARTRYHNPELLPS